jgi:hypothetical protein
MRLGFGRRGNLDASCGLEEGNSYPVLAIACALEAIYIERACRKTILLEQVHVKYHQQQPFSGEGLVPAWAAEGISRGARKRNEKVSGRDCISCSNEDNDRGRSAVSRN